jgi:hypothetical protein
MPFHLYRGSPGGHGVVLIAGLATVAMTQNRSGRAYEIAGSNLGSQSDTRHMAVDWAAAAG